MTVHYSPVGHGTACGQRAPKATTTERSDVTCIRCGQTWKFQGRNPRRHH